MQFAPSGLTFLAHVALWKTARVCSDDHDEVSAAIEEIETAWFHGTNEVANSCIASSGPASVPTHATVFDWAPIPPMADPPAGADAQAIESHRAAYRLLCEGIRRQRSRELKACLPIARAVLRYCRAYARRRVVVDDAATHYTLRVRKMSDEWAAIARSETKLGMPVQTAQDVELESEHFRTPDKALWWFLAAAIAPVNALSRTLEAITRSYGESYRSANRDLFCAAAVWEVKYSPEAIAAKRAPVVPDKRQRQGSEDPNLDRQRPPGPSGRTLRRKRYRLRKLEAAQAAGGDDKTAQKKTEPNQPPAPAADQRTAATDAAGGRGGGFPGGRGQRSGNRSGGRGFGGGNRWRR